MTNFNKKITIQEARELLKSKSGANYINTPHNREMMAKAVDELLGSLQKIKS